MHFTMKKEDWQTMKMTPTHNDSFKLKLKIFKIERSMLFP